MVANNKYSKQEIVMTILNKWPSLTDKQQEILNKNISIKRFRKNEMLYRDEESPDQIFFLLFGKVKIYKDGIGGRNQILRVAKTHEFFGYRAFFAKEYYKTIGMAFEDSYVATIPINVVIDIMKSNYEICFFFIHELSKELGASDNRTVNLTQKHIRGRLAEALLFLKDSYGLEEDGYTLSIYLSREDLANLSNMTTSNAIRTLSSFANEKLIAIDGRKIKIIDYDELKKVSQMG